MQFVDKRGVGVKNNVTKRFEVIDEVLVCGKEFFLGSKIFRVVHFEIVQDYDVGMVGGEIVVEFISLGNEVWGFTNSDVVMPDRVGGSDFHGGVQIGGFQKMPGQSGGGAFTVGTGNADDKFSPVQVRAHEFLPFHENFPFSTQSGFRMVVVLVKNCRGYRQDFGFFQVSRVVTQENGDAGVSDFF